LNAATPNPSREGGAAGEVGAAEKGQRQYGNAQQGDQGEGRAMKVAGGGPSVHACAVFFRAKSREGKKINQTP
jgi:hypothetical protein